MTHGGRRHGLNSTGSATTFKIAIDEKTKNLMDAAAKRLDVSRAEIVRRALRLYLTRSAVTTMAMTKKGQNDPL